MYHLLIVDDEPGIIEGLKLVIQRNLVDCMVRCVAYTGAQGFNLAMQEKPDIILTDVRMPQVDGLEMIRRLQVAGCKARFIILSGFSEFQYAQTAMALGVKYYITKPVEEEKLFHVIHKACLDIEAEKANTLKIKSLGDNVQRNIKGFVLRNILDSVVDKSSYDLLDFCGFPISHKQYGCALLEFNSESIDLTGNLFYELANEIETHLNQYANKIVLFYSGLQIAVIISDHEQINYAHLVMSIGSVKNEIVEKWGIFVTIGVGQIYEDIGGISQSFEEARYALDYKVIKGSGSIIPYKEIQNIAGSRRAVSQEDICRFEECIDNMDIHGCNDIIQEIFDKMAKDEALSLSDLKLQCLSIILSGIRKMPAVQFQFNEFLGQNILSLESVSKFETLDQLKNWLILTVGNIIELKFMRKVPLKKDIIADIKEYVAENFDKSISLAELSEKFFINPYYLSRQFKEKTGDTYLNYLLKLRINRAKELLEKTDLKVYEVCEMVGYSDTNYFSKLFEKFAGCRPSEFKKKMGSQELWATNPIKKLPL